jgi:chromosome segregation ATPase
VILVSIIGMLTCFSDSILCSELGYSRAGKGLEACDDHLMATDYLIEPQPLLPPLPATMSRSVLEPDTNVVTYIERLFATIDRLRGERDSLSRDVEFLESESRFTIEALEAKLSASISSASDKTVATISQLKTEMDELHSHLAEVSERNATTIESKNCEIKRLGLVVQTLAVSHEAMTSQRDGLLAELQRKDSQWEKDLELARTAEQETRRELEDVLHREREVATHLQDVESERDSLRTQITNLMTDMQDVQEELNNAEGRYTTLQFHQLSNMTNNESTRNLRGHIEELEDRVMRRTEQIGIHQHDIKRLETNLRLQEERLAEMTTELEMMAAQKDAMVEDCADAREARDEALIRVERLEEELESLDGRNVDNANIVETLIAIIAQTVCQARVRLTEGLTRIQKEHVTQVDRCREENRAIEQELEQQVTSLQSQIEEHGRLLDISKREVTRIRDRVQEEVEGRAQDKKQHAMALLSEKERSDNADGTISQLRGELETLERNLQQSNVDLQSVEDEKLTLRQQMTELEAEVQRCKSLSHYLEIQIKDR